MFGVRVLITQAQIWKSFLVKNSESSLYLPLPRQLKLGKSLQTYCVNFFWLLLSEKNLNFGKHLYCNKTRNDYACKTSCTRLCHDENFSFNQCHNKEFCIFLGKVNYKSNRKLFSCICIAWYDWFYHERDWENSWQSPNPFRAFIRICKHRKRFILLEANMELINIEQDVFVLEEESY